MKRIVAAAVAVIAIGAGVYFLTRPSADFDHLAGAATRAWGGARVTSGKDVIPDDRFAGTGTVVAMFSARNVRDHDVELAVPKGERERLAKDGIRASVVFVPVARTRGYGDVDSAKELAHGSTTMPAKADGEIVHVFQVTDCRRGRDIPVSFPLEVDGHEAQVDLDAPQRRRQAAFLQGRRDRPLRRAHARGLLGGGERGVARGVQREARGGAGDLEQAPDRAFGRDDVQALAGGLELLGGAQDRAEGA